MSDKYIFSIFLDCYNRNHLKESIESIINQSLDFENNMEILVTDDDLNESELILEYKNKYPNNFLIINQDSMEEINGKYICFMSNCLYSKNMLNDIYNFSLKHQTEDISNLIICPIKFKDENKKYEFDFNIDKESVDLKEDYESIHIESSNIFIKSEIFKNSIQKYEKSKSLKYFNKYSYIYQLIIKNPKMGFLNNSSVYKFNEMNILNETNDKKRQYISDFKDFTTELIKNNLIERKDEGDSKLPEVVQYLILHHMKTLIKLDIDEFLSKEDAKSLKRYLNDILKFIDEESINKYIKDTHMKSFLIYLKNDEFNIRIVNGETLLESKNYCINNLSKHNIWLDIVDLKNQTLNLTGNFTSNCYKEVICVEAIKIKNSGEEERFISTPFSYNTPSRRTISFLSVPWKFSYDFDVKIPIKNNELCEIILKVRYSENGNIVESTPNIKFRNYAGLSELSHYFVRNSHIILFLSGKIIVSKYSYLKMLKHEFLDLKTILKNKEPAFKRAILLRTIYSALYPILKRKDVWLFMDRQELCGDNGEHLFSYAFNQKDNKDKYFVINKDSEDYDRLKNIYGKKILEFGSMKHLFTFLRSNKFISSQITIPYINPFSKHNPRLYSGLFTSRLYFLQHGVGKYDMSHWLTKYNKNLSLLLTVSDYDWECFNGENYNYDEKVIQTLGFPRYDNLTNENLKKKIVIIPTWRINIETEEDLYDSEYFKRWNNLLNNERLVKYANDRGYEIVFKPHPNSLIFLNCFDINKVKLDDVKGYHKILCDSSLMITDYSSVSFDFAYLKKPIIYYQYGDDYHFGSDPVFDEDAANFGDIISDEEDLLNKIIEYIENDCLMEDEYKNKVDKFFKYTDKNNCKRVYEFILEDEG
ncbi:CDP-glycerol:glycerophosphate glycerophosphotransferase [Methanobrevibacter sp.]|uniref:CDP-glycerol:glycerophosphate glycerophosphotransferase n=1 Tax=Methanobrevibacter sp. TaxID=66852 RepID=UPI00386FAF76